MAMRKIVKVSELELELDKFSGRELELMTKLWKIQNNPKNATPFTFEEFAELEPILDAIDEKEAKKKRNVKYYRSRR